MMIMIVIMMIKIMITMMTIDANDNSGSIQLSHKCLSRGDTMDHVDLEKQKDMEVNKD